MFNKTLFIIGISSLFFSCKKESIVINTTPTIEFVSISPTIANQYTDSVSVAIKYTDGDGDLGENNASVKNCFIRDNRIGIVYEFRIKQLAPDNSPITGTLNLELGGQGITDTSSQQYVSYTIYVKDRAGHISNSIVTSSILIRQ